MKRYLLEFAIAHHREDMDQFAVHGVIALESENGNSQLQIDGHFENAGRHLVDDELGQVGHRRIRKGQRQPNAKTHDQTLHQSSALHQHHSSRSKEPVGQQRQQHCPIVNDSDLLDIFVAEGKGLVLNDQRVQRRNTG